MRQLRIFTYLFTFLLASLFAFVGELRAELIIQYKYVKVPPQRFFAKKQMHFPTGTYTIGEADLAVAARSIPMVWERQYRSNVVVKLADLAYNEPQNGPLGYGWTNGWLVRIVGDAYVNGAGRYIYFSKDANGNYLTNMAEGLSLTKTAYGYELTEPGRYTYSFDTSGKLTTVKDRRGNSATLNYDTDGKLTTITDVTGRPAFSLTYTAVGRIASVTDLAGQSITYDYDPIGNLIKVSRGSDPVATYSYNDNHGVISKTNAIGETYTIDYIANWQDKGIIKRILDPKGTVLLRQGEPTTGHETSFSYNFDGKVFYETGYNGTTFVKYLGNGGQVVAVYELKAGQQILVSKIEYQGRTTITTDAAGNVTTVQTDEWGNIIKRVDGEGGEKRSSYTADNKLLTATDQLGTVTRNEYDSVGNLVKTVWAYGRPEETSTTYSYNSYGEAMSETIAAATKSATYNNQGLPATIIDETGNTFSYEYSVSGLLTTYTDPQGNKTEYSYDAKGNLLSKKDPLGNITTYSYNAADRLTSVTDPLSRIATYESDYKGRTTAIIDPLGNRTEYDYDGSGNLIRTTRGDSVITITYDSNNRPITITDPEGNTTSYGYSDGTCNCSVANASPATVTDPLGNTISSAFDKAKRLKELTDPMGNVTAYIRNPAGMVTTQVDANRNATYYRYDGLKRIAEQTDANGGATSFTYNGRSNLTSLTDAKGNTTTFDYDSNGRVIKETRPLGQTTEYTYYPSGTIKTAKDGKGQVTTFAYDKASRLTEIAYADNKKDTFQYDPAGNMTGYGNESVSATIQYDELGRKTSETVTTGTVAKTYSYTYDSKGNKQSYTSPEGPVYSYSYDKNNRLKTITQDNKTISYNYQTNRLTNTTFPNGITTSYQYNDNSWLTTRETKKETTTIESDSYSFDSVGNITSKTGDSNINYGYDPVYQLTSANSEAFSYDKSGNRTISGYSHNRNNELLTTDTATYTYDNNGNTITKTENGQTTTYSYNSRNRLESVQLPDGTTATYTYDPFGRRIRKQTTTETTNYLYANEGLIGEYDTAGTIRKAYAWRPNSIWGTDPLLMQQNETIYYYHNDHLGTPKKLTDASGNVVWSATYSAFGEATVDEASTVENNLRFPGQYYDEETGLHYNWNRYYDPEMGRYISKDPIGFSGRDVNLYRYVNNNSGSWVDPYGLMEVKVGPNIPKNPFIDPNVNKVKVFPDLPGTLDITGSVKPKNFDPKQLLNDPAAEFKKLIDPNNYNYKIKIEYKCQF